MPAPSTYALEYAWSGWGSQTLRLGNTKGRRELALYWQLLQTAAGSLFLRLRPCEDSKASTDMLRFGFALDGWAERWPSDASDPLHVEGLRLSNAAHPDSEGWISLRANKARVKLATGTPLRYRFALVNLVNDADTPPEWDGLIEGTPVRIRGHARYMERVSVLGTLDAYAACAEAVVSVPDEGRALDVMDILCDVLTLAKGSRVQWLHGIALDDADQSLSWFSGSGLTKPYFGVSPIQSEQLQSFVEAMVPPIAHRRRRDHTQLRRTLGMWIDGTLQQDFLEMRGGKLAATTDALRSMVIGNAKRDETFVEQLQRLSATLRVPFSEQDATRFKIIRNALLHEGQFECQRTRAATATPWPFVTPSEEYFWMLPIVDRWILRALGWRGSFTDRSPLSKQKSLPPDP